MKDNVAEVEPLLLHGRGHKKPKPKRGRPVLYNDEAHKKWRATVKKYTTKKRSCKPTCALKCKFISYVHGECSVENKNKPECSRCVWNLDAWMEKAKQKNE